MRFDVEMTHDELTAKEILRVVRAAKDSARFIAGADTEAKNAVLRSAAKHIQQQRADILTANQKDVDAAKARGTTGAFIDRLTLSDKRIDEMIASLESIIALPDPVGETLRTFTPPSGIEIRKVRVPLGVIGIVYESRPNVTSDCAALCIKSGNAVVLRGGSEAFESNRAIHAALVKALAEKGLPEAVVSLVPVRERSGVDFLLKQDRYIDVIIPRGGESLIRKVVETSTIPVLKHAKGLCHVYVDAGADLKMAQAITINAKCQRPGVCNALETLLVHKSVAARFLPGLVHELQNEGVTVRGDSGVQEIVAGVDAADEKDWETEYLDLILAIRIVDSLDEALVHIRRYGSGHSDAIVTADEAAGERFLREVDSAAVYVNASTRFTDGFQFGFGAEMGISTDRLHARGPVALEELTTYKYTIRGTGQVRE